MLKWFLKKQDERPCTGSASLVAGCCDHGDERSGSLKCRDFHDYARNYIIGFSRGTLLFGVN